MGITTDPNDPELKQHREDGQQVSHIVLSEEERAKGFVRPIRRSYIHVGIRPTYPLRDLTEEERVNNIGYVKYEEYPDGHDLTGRFWTQAQLDSGCGAVTTMGFAIAETYARQPDYYSNTFCAKCGKYFRVGPYGEFVWDDEHRDRVGT